MGNFQPGDPAGRHDDARLKPVTVQLSGQVLEAVEIGIAKAGNIPLRPRYR
jgi:hypothetical protein